MTIPSFVYLSLVQADDHNKVSYRKQIARQHSSHKLLAMAGDGVESRVLSRIHFQGV